MSQLIVFLVLALGKCYITGKNEVSSERNQMNLKNFTGDSVGAGNHHFWRRVTRKCKELFIFFVKNVKAKSPNPNN